MTDKQIIYNCPHISFTDWGTYACKLYNPRDKNCLVVGGNCDSNVNCPYKQLKHKEQECKELKDLANHNGRVCNQRLDKIDKLEHDNNELQGQLDQLKEALTEIKEIAEKIGDECEYSFFASCAKKAKKQILQKISEVLDDN